MRNQYKMRQRAISKNIKMIYPFALQSNHFYKRGKGEVAKVLFQLAP